MAGSDFTPGGRRVL